MLTELVPHSFNAAFLGDVRFSSICFLAYFLPCCSEERDGEGFPTWSVDLHLFKMSLLSFRPKIDS